MGLEYERLHENLRLLGMNRMDSIMDNYLEIAGKENKSVIQILDHLCSEELQQKSTGYFNVRIKTAHFPFRKSLEEFDFSFQPSIDKKMINELSSLKFAYNKENVLFLGPPGVGKTHLAIALGIEALKARMSVYFLSASDLLQRLRKGLNDGELNQMFTRICRPKVLIIDEIGYLPLEKQDANLFFQLISRRYEKGSLILTSNQPFRNWGTVFGDDVVASAILDRLLHHSTVMNIKGESYRIKDRKRLGLIDQQKVEGKS
ncbi:ATP-binding protein [Candidatus Micrarchaeota archaeon]|nr:ATP-binding protein [Candidatus Micrarchaeota archaeon]